MSRLTKVYSQPEVTCTLSYTSLNKLLSDEAFKAHNEAFLHFPCDACDTCLFYTTRQALEETLCPD